MKNAMPIWLPGISNICPDTLILGRRNNIKVLHFAESRSGHIFQANDIIGLKPGGAGSNPVCPTFFKPMILMESRVFIYGKAQAVTR